MTTLVIDTGQNIIGVYSVESCEYIGYRRDRISEALGRVQNADEVITYNGEYRDLLDLARFAGIDGEFSLKGKHIDMRIMIWAPLPLGSSLIRTYGMHFDSCPDFPFGRPDSPDADYEGGNQRDVYMTLKLWECWKGKTLDIMGYGYTHH